ncbi:hypothetical protein GEMRC1_002219 [Eukaryota sp. GEM-RC1]
MQLKGHAVLTALRAAEQERIESMDKQHLARKQQLTAQRRFKRALHTIRSHKERELAQTKHRQLSLQSALAEERAAIKHRPPVSKDQTSYSDNLLSSREAVPNLTSKHFCRTKYYKSLTDLPDTRSTRCQQSFEMPGTAHVAAEMDELLHSDRVATQKLQLNKSLTLTNQRLVFTKKQSDRKKLDEDMFQEISQSVPPPFSGNVCPEPRRTSKRERVSDESLFKTIEDLVS